MSSGSAKLLTFPLILFVLFALINLPAHAQLKQRRYVSPFFEKPLTTRFRSRVSLEPSLMSFYNCEGVSNFFNTGMLLCGIENAKECLKTNLNKSSCLEKHLECQDIVRMGRESISLLCSLREKLLTGNRQSFSLSNLNNNR